MISLEEVREELDMPDLTDEDILRIRNNLYSLINKILDEIKKEY